MKSFSALCLGLSLIAGLLVSGCGGSGDAESTGADVQAVAQIFGGSVGDGPIIGATVVVRDVNGHVLLESESDAFANYSVKIKARGNQYPLTVTAGGGEDLVTGAPADFELLSIALLPSVKTVNLNPYSTLVVETASRMPGGVSSASLAEAAGFVIDRLNFGYDSALIPDPITSPIDSANIHYMVRVSEALGELFRRIHAAYGAAAGLSMEQVVDLLAADLVDGKLDGLGASGAEAQLAALANLMAGQISIESLRNELLVNGMNAEAAMDAAIQTCIGEQAPQTGLVPATEQLLENARVAVIAAQAVAPTAELEVLAGILGQLAPGMLPSEVAALLPQGEGARLSGAIIAVTQSGELAGLVNGIFSDGGIAPPAENGAPVISGTPATSIQAGETYSFTPTASDPDGHALTFSIVNRPAWATFSNATGTLAGTPSDGDAGVFADIRISVSDGQLSAVLPAFDITVTAKQQEPVPVNHAPEISGTPETTVQVGGVYSFTPTASDPDGDRLTFSIVNRPAWAAFSTTTGTLSGTPADGDAGVFAGIGISVSDGELSASLPAFEITVAEKQQEEPSTPVMSVADLTVPEEVGVAEVVLTLSEASTEDVSVEYATVDGSARSPYDYEAVSGRIVLVAGTTRGTVQIPIVDDAIDEPNESFSVRFYNVVNAELERDSTIITILDNDPEPTVAFASAGRSVFKDEGKVTVDVELSAASGMDVVVPYTVSGTAQSPADYQIAPASPLYIQAGDRSARLEVVLVDDGTVEPDQTIQLALGSPTYAGVGEPAEYLLTVMSRDNTSVQACNLDPIGTRGTTYYVCDCGTGAAAGCVVGNDANSGRDPSQPWRTFGKARSAFAGLAAGDTIAFCAGGSFTNTGGRWNNTNSTAQSPVILRSYDAPWGRGGEPMPLIRASAADVTGFDFSDGGRNIREQGYVIADLNLRGTGASHTGRGIFGYNVVDEVTLCRLTIDSFNLGVHVASPCNRWTIAESRIVNNHGHGVLGSSDDLKIINNVFDNNGFGGTVHNHNIYVGKSGGSTQGIRVIGNQLSRSAFVNGMCQGTSLVVHGQHRDMLIADNYVREDVGKAHQGCWGITVDNGYSTPEGFRNVTLRGNRVENVGNVGIGVTACDNCMIENNVVISEQPFKVTAIAVPNRSRKAEDTPLNAATVRNNSILVKSGDSTGISVGGEGTGHRVVSNALQYTGTGAWACFNLNLPSSSYATVDNNLCSYTSGEWERGSGGLSSWRSASGFDLNSLFADPQYLSRTIPYDLRAGSASSPMVDRGHPTLSSPTAFGGVPRDTNPDIGAHER